MNTKFLKNNLHFIIICLSVVVLGIIVGIAIDTDTNKKLTIKENEPDGESKINKLIIKFVIRVENNGFEPLTPCVQSN